MKPRDLGEVRRWVSDGTTLFADAIAALDGDATTAPSALPGWSRKHLIAHVAANADAIGNLVRWAWTGEVTPMYSSPEQRNADIEAGSRLPVRDLVARFERSADALHAAMERLTDLQWSAEVITAQGRSVPASETPWMRAREVMVHTVDMGTGLTFADLPADFLIALCDDIVARRSAAAGTPAAGQALRIETADRQHQWCVAGQGEPVVVTGPLGAVAAYLAGRANGELSTGSARPLPRLPAWL